MEFWDDFGHDCEIEVPVVVGRCILFGSLLYLCGMALFLVYGVLLAHPLSCRCRESSLWATPCSLYYLSHNHYL